MQVTVQEAIQTLSNALGVAADRFEANERRLTQLEINREIDVTDGELQVLQPLLGGIKAVIICVMIEDGNRVSYKAMWATGNNIEEKWISSLAITGLQRHKRIAVGFGAVKL